MKAKTNNFGEAEFASTHPIVPRTSQSTQAVHGITDWQAIAPCPSCGHTELNLVRMPNYSLHYAARRCGQCDTFRGWEPKPENQNKQQRWQTTISQLLKSPILSQWEREFLTNLQGSRSLSPRQLAVVQKIENQVGGLQ